MDQRKVSSYEILKESWVYQEVVQETRQATLQQGEQKGIAEGIMRFVELRFPSLLTQAREILACETTLEQLHAIQNKLYLANTLEEATTALQ